jgi:hypothetical protein
VKRDKKHILGFLEEIEKLSKKYIEGRGVVLSPDAKVFGIFFLI